MGQQSRLKSANIANTKRKLLKFNNPLNIFFSLILVIFIILLFMIPNVIPLLLLAFTFSNFIFLTIYAKPLKKLKEDFKQGDLPFQITLIVAGLVIIIGISLAVFCSDSKYYLNKPGTISYNHLMCALASLLFLFHISVEQSLFVTLKERLKSLPCSLAIVLIVLELVLGLVVLLTGGLAPNYLPLKYFIHMGYILLALCPRYTMLRFLFSKKA
jgi:hypothetical protein